MLPSPATRTLLLIRLTLHWLFLVLDADHLAGAGGFLRRERSLERSGRVFRAADRRGLALQRAGGEIGELLAQRPAANAVEHRPVGGVRAVKLVARHDAEI